MRTYTLVTGIVFLLLVAVHIARLTFEGLHVLRDPFFVFSTSLALGLSLWALRLVFKSRPQQLPPK